MAYEFKKLSEMELLDSVPENATVLAEVDGVIRRVPSAGLGGSGGSGVAETDILPETMLEFTEVSADSGSVFMWKVDEQAFTLVPGETYQVLWGEDTYTVTAKEATLGDTPVAYIGNGALIGVSEDANEPFLVYILTPELTGSETGASIVVDCETTESTSHTVRIYQVSEASGGVSWNKVTNRPGGYVESFPEVTYTFDGNIEGKETVVITESEDGAFRGYVRLGDIGDSAQVLQSGMATTFYQGDTEQTIESSGAEAAATMREPLNEEYQIFGSEGLFFAFNDFPSSALNLTGDTIHPAGVYGLFTRQNEVEHTFRISKVVFYAADVLRKWPKELVETDWNALENRPFGETLETAVVFPETSVTLTYSTDMGVHMIEDTPQPEQLAVWQGDWSTMKVIWDGTEYVCECQTISGINFVGNIDLMMGTGDNNMPFVIMMGTMGGSSFYQIVSFKDDTTVQTVTHTVSVSTDSLATVTPLDSKFIDEVPWDKITDKPFGDFTAGTVIFEGPVTMGQNILVSGFNPAYAIAGVNYTVHIGDVEYTGTGDTLAYNGSACINICDDSSTRVAYIWIEESASPLIYVYDTDTYPNGSEYNVRIAFAEDTTLTLDSKYLPDTLVTKTELTNYAHDYVIINSSTEGSTKQFKLTVDDTGAITATEITTE